MCSKRCEFITVWPHKEEPITQSLVGRDKFSTHSGVKRPQNSKKNSLLPFQRKNPRIKPNKLTTMRGKDNNNRKSISKRFWNENKQQNKKSDKKKSLTTANRLQQTQRQQNNLWENWRANEREGQHTLNNSIHSHFQVQSKRNRQNTGKNTRISATKMMLFSRKTHVVRFIRHGDTYNFVYINESIHRLQQQHQQHCDNSNVVETTKTNHMPVVHTFEECWIIHPTEWAYRNQQHMYGSCVIWDKSIDHSE